MMAKQYKTEVLGSDPPVFVIVTAEQITDQNDEYFRFWRTIDKNNVEGLVPNDLFKATFTEVKDAPTTRGRNS